MRCGVLVVRGGEGRGGKGRGRGWERGRGGVGKGIYGLKGEKRGMYTSND